MSGMRRFLSVLAAVFMLLTMPITTGVSQALAEGTTEQTGSASYVIYRCAWNTTTNRWTSFDRLADTTELTWTDSNKVTAGTRYQYGVKAYFAQRTDSVSGNRIGGADDRGNLGAVSPLKSMARVTTRAITGVTAGSGQLTVKWSGTKTVSGYDICYSTAEDFSNNVSYVSITSASTYQTVLTGLSSGTKYYIRVRAYQDVGGMTYYGRWSVVRNGTAK